jgi:hypothetical protein
VHNGESDGRSVLQTLFTTVRAGKIDKRQLAGKGLSTADALISFLQPFFEAIDKGDNIARIFSTDVFSKGFDRIDHNLYSWGNRESPTT